MSLSWNIYDFKHLMVKNIILLTYVWRKLSTHSWSQKIISINPLRIRLPEKQKIEIQNKY